MPISIASPDEVLTEMYVLPGFVLSTSQEHSEIHPKIWVYFTFPALTPILGNDSVHDVNSAWSMHFFFQLKSVKKDVMSLC